jgi:hypothetical protein
MGFLLSRDVKFITSLFFLWQTFGLVSGNRVFHQVYKTIVNYQVSTYVSPRIQFQPTIPEKTISQRHQ